MDILFVHVYVWLPGGIGGLEILGYATQSNHKCI